MDRVRSLLHNRPNPMADARCHSTHPGSHRLLHDNALAEIF